MPNIHETIKQLSIEAGGPGSGRKPGFGSGKHPEFNLMKRHFRSKGYKTHKGHEEIIGIPEDAVGFEHVNGSQGFVRPNGVWEHVSGDSDEDKIKMGTGLKSLQKHLK